MVWLRAFLLLSGFVLFTLPLMPVQALLNLFKAKAGERLPHWYHRQLARLLGLRLRVAGPLPGPGGVLLVSNHASWLDIVILSAILPVSFIAKKEVGGWPFFGSLARLQRTIFVDRERRHTTGHETNALTAALQQGRAIVLFPEGTSGNGRSVRHFKSSYFAAVPDAACAVVPVTLAFTEVWGLPITLRERPLFAWYGGMELAPHLWGALKAGPLTVDVRFREAQHLAQKHGRKALARDCEKAIRADLAALLHPGAERG
jgi:1-acyl-sn-glycerol-3-phosphate acyltransferase